MKNGSAVCGSGCALAQEGTAFVSVSVPDYQCYYCKLVPSRLSLGLLSDLSADLDPLACAHFLAIVSVNCARRRLVLFWLSQCILLK